MKELKAQVAMLVAQMKLSKKVEKNKMKRDENI